MSDDQPTGSCCCCARRDPWRRDDGIVPLACGVCLSRLRSWLGEIPGLVAELAGGGLVMRDRVGEVLGQLVEDAEGKTSTAPVAVYGLPPVRLAAAEPDHPLVVRAGRPVEHRDLVANVLPAGPIGGQAYGGRVSGSPEPRLPINEDRTDLLAPARPATSASAPLAYAEQDNDQIGFSPVAATLDGLAEGLRLHRGKGERRPFPAVTNLCTWLLERLDDAAEDWSGFGDLFEEVGAAYNALRGQLGHIDIPSYRKGIPCPKCSALTVLRLNGSDFIECGSCPAVLTVPEYEEYTMTLATALTAEERERRKRAAADRKAVFGLLRSMHAVGWRHQMHWLDLTSDDDDDTPSVEDDEGGRLIHRWTRGAESIALTVIDGTRYGGLWYADDDEADEGPVASVGVSVQWVADNGTKRLHALAVAAGVLSVPKERD